MQVESTPRIGGEGHFDEAIVVRSVRARVSALRLYYELQVHRIPTPSGALRLEFTIETSGAVTSVRVMENTTNEDNLAECVAWSIERLRFNPAPTGGKASYRYRFVFTPES